MKSLIFIIVLISLALCFADDEFFQKARSGDAAAVQRFLESGTHVSSRDSKGNTALVIAAGRGQEEVIKVLLQAGASVDESTENGIFEGINVLAWACSQGRRGAVVLLLQAGANPQHVQEKGVFHGKTPLMWASSQGRTEIVNLLISAGADVDLASQTGNFRGKTSLMWASSQGRLETVASLLQHGSNVNALDGDKMSALMWAAGSEASDTSHQRGLMEKGMKGNMDVVQLLLKYGAKIDMRDKDGITPLMYACYHGHSGAVKVLLNAGADAGFQNKAGRSALHLAINSGFNEAAAAIRAGATIPSLPIERLVQVSTCGWILSILRAPVGTGVYPLTDNETNLYHTAAPQVLGDRSFAPPLGLPSLQSSCEGLARKGLRSSLGDLLSIVEELVEYNSLSLRAAGRSGVEETGEEKKGACASNVGSNTNTGGSEKSEKAFIFAPVNNNINIPLSAMLQAVDVVVENLELPNFTANVRARGQLRSMYIRWKEAESE